MARIAEMLDDCNSKRKFLRSNMYPVLTNHAYVIKGVYDKVFNVGKLEETEAYDSPFKILTLQIK